MGISIQLREARTGVRDADALAPRGLRAQPGPVVAEANLQHPVLPPGRNLQPPSLGPERDAVQNRVLDERLQREIRNARLERGRIDIDTHSQAVVEPHTLDLE